jgi:hypothetical protein
MIVRGLTLEVGGKGFRSPSLERSGPPPLSEALNHTRCRAKRSSNFLSYVFY